MKKMILIAGILLSFSSCSLIGGLAGVAGSVAGPIIGATGNVIAGIIGSKNGEIKAKGVKYRFSEAEVILENRQTIVTGFLSHNGPVKRNVVLEIPCQDKDGHGIGDAVARIDELKRNQKWNFKAVLDSSEVRTCKMSEAIIFEEGGNPVKEGDNSSKESGSPASQQEFLPADPQ